MSLSTDHELEHRPWAGALTMSLSTDHGPEHRQGAGALGMGRSTDHEPSTDKAPEHQQGAGTPTMGCEFRRCSWARPVSWGTVFLGPGLVCGDAV